MVEQISFEFGLKFVQCGYWLETQGQWVPNLWLRHRGNEFQNYDWDTGQWVPKFMTETQGQWVPKFMTETQGQWVPKFMTGDTGAMSSKIYDWDTGAMSSKIYDWDTGAMSSKIYDWRHRGNEFQNLWLETQGQWVPKFMMKKYKFEIRQNRWKARSWNTKNFPSRWSK